MNLIIHEIHKFQYTLECHNDKIRSFLICSQILGRQVDRQRLCQHKIVLAASPLGRLVEVTQQRP